MNNDSPKVVIQDINSEDYPKSNPYFGIKSESVLKKRTIRYLEGVNSIYDPGVFYKEGRYINAIKAFIIKGDNKNEILNNYNLSFENDNYYVFPKFFHKYKFSVDDEEYTLSIDRKGYIGVNANYFYTEGQTKYFYYYDEKYYFDDFQSNKDELLQIYLVNECFMILFLTTIEIDGFFHCSKEFEISNFQAEEVFYINKKYEKIPSESYLIYEIKSGNKLLDLLNQLLKHYTFLSKFFGIFKKYNFKKFVFFCFYRSKEKIIIDDKYLNNAFSKIELPIIIMRYNDKIFNENIYYENVEINHICELKTKIDNLEVNLNAKIDKLGYEIKEILKNQNNHPPNWLSYPIQFPAMYVPLAQIFPNNNQNQNNN